MSPHLAHGSPRIVSGKDSPPEHLAPTASSQRKVFLCSFDPAFAQLVQHGLDTLKTVVEQRLRQGGKVPAPVVQLVREGFSEESIQDVRHLVARYRKDNIAARKPITAEIALFAGSLCALHQEGAAVCFADMAARRVEARRVDKYPITDWSKEVGELFKISLPTYLGRFRYASSWPEGFQPRLVHTGSLIADAAGILQERFESACLAHPKDHEILTLLDRELNLNSKQNLTIVVNGRAQQVFVGTLVRQHYWGKSVAVIVDKATRRQKEQQGPRISIVTSGIQKEHSIDTPTLIIAMSRLPKSFPSFNGVSRWVLLSPRVRPVTANFPA